MQKWSPEPLVPDPETHGAFVADGALASPHDPSSRVVAGDRRFRSERGYTDPHVMLSHLTTDERSQLYELVELELKRQFDDRFGELEEERDRELERCEREHAERNLDWQRNLAERWESTRDEVVRDLAREAVELALELAAKVVRRQVALDPGVLIRALETVLFKLEAGVRMVVTVAPADAKRLTEDPEIRERLRIAEVKEDRRVSPGGCVVQADNAEWDVTLERQLETLGEAVREAIETPAAGGAKTPVGEENQHDAIEPPELD